MTAAASKIDIILPKKSYKIKIINGEQRDGTGKLIVIYGAGGIVKCAIGLECEVAICLMQKYIDVQSQGTDFQRTLDAENARIQEERRKEE